MWEGRHDSPYHTVTGALRFLRCWQNAKHRAVLSHVSNPKAVSVWKPPPDGWLKLNIDVSLLSDPAAVGYGFVLRN